MRIRTPSACPAAQTAPFRRLTMASDREANALSTIRDQQDSFEAYVRKEVIHMRKHLLHSLLVAGSAAGAVVFLITQTAPRISFS